MHQEALGKNGKECSESVSDPGDRTIERLDSACTEIKSDLPDSSSSSNIGSSSDPKLFQKRKNKVDGTCTEVPLEASSSPITGRRLSSQSHVEQDKATTSTAPDEVVNSVKSDDIHLSIRMPSGNRLEIKLTKQDVLREVKNFVDENLGSGIGSYDLSMIYPKRVFTEQGTGKILVQEKNRMSPINMKF
jgi:UBX domain-containing protein 1/4